ncbi:MAG: phosphate ABC transporter substrate-binding protein PstS [Calditrichaeota bacterium]|nr:phosphate ABC transporter substrate-binding protein PstS [Calditrichota bacterium]
MILMNLLISYLILFALSLSQTKLTGAGATFPAPVYAVWAYDYYKTKDIQLEYDAVGSGSGIKRIKARSVDFGASDAPVNSDELRKNKLIQFPAIIGAVVPVCNIPELENSTLRLSGPVLADIFAQKIKQWNAKQIQDLNPRVNLPDRPIQCIYRSDGSGTTAIFTKYLAAVSPEFAKTIGSGKLVNWPQSYIANGNQGIANFVKRLPYSISYVQSSYAVTEKLAVIQLRNKNGNFVSADISNIQMAAQFAEWSLENDFELWLVDAPGDQSWPITGASFILLDENNKRAIEAAYTFFNWCFKNGKQIAESLRYVPIPESLAEKIDEYIRTFAGRSVSL